MTDSLREQIIAKIELWFGPQPKAESAADAILALPEIAELREALKPFADCIDQIAPDEDDEEWAKFRLLIKNYRRAAAAYAAISTHKRK